MSDPDLEKSMFKCDTLVYIQMQKTGCTHIASLLSHLFDGDQIGKHNAATEDQIASGKYFISSIRNPWDWYLSLWTYGVQGSGALMLQLTRWDLWRDVYDKSDNVESFRRWLKLIHHPGNSCFMGEGYGNTVIPGLCGFMTYRYLYLCCRNAIGLFNPESITVYTDLVRHENKNRYIDFFIRRESLEDDLCEAIEKVRPLTQEEREFIYSGKKTNTSRRSLLISDYYDKESIELIRSRDRLLVDKFDYSPPQIAEHGAVPDGGSATPRSCQ